MKAIRLLRLPADPARPITLESVGGNLYSALVKAVGGWIEPVSFSEPMTGARCTMYVNEEGKLLGLPVNQVATILTRRLAGLNDVIVGDAAVAGPLGDDGEHLDFSDGTATALTDWIGCWSSARTACRAERDRDASAARPLTSDPERR